MIPVSFSFLFLALPLSLSCSRSQSALALIGTAPVSFDADLFLYFYLCVARLLCRIIMLCSHSANSLLLFCMYSVFLSRTDFCLVLSSPVVCLTYLSTASQLSAACGPFAFGRSPLDCTAFCGSCCSLLRPGPHIPSLKSATGFQFCFCFNPNSVNAFSG